MNDVRNSLAACGSQSAAERPIYREARSAREAGDAETATALLRKHVREAPEHSEGWNDLALGLKYNVIADVENQFALSTGLSWRLSNGHALTLHGGVDELNPYVTAAKGIRNPR